jgi:predicted RecA/RadA family phage recombinase
MFTALFYIVGIVLALNRVREKCVQRSLPVPEGTKSGDPLVIGAGKIPAVALIDRGKDTEDEATVQMSLGSFEFEVEGKEKEGKEKAIEAGDPVYLKGGKLSADSGGDLFGYAMDPVAKGKTASIEVKLAAV